MAGATFDWDVALSMCLDARVATKKRGQMHTTSSKNPTCRAASPRKKRRAANVAALTNKQAAAAARVQVRTVLNSGTRQGCARQVWHARNDEIRAAVIINCKDSLKIDFVTLLLWQFTWYRSIEKKLTAPASNNLLWARTTRYDGRNFKSRAFDLNWS